MVYSTDLNTTEDFIITSKGYDNLGEWYITNVNVVKEIIEALLGNYKVLSKKNEEVYNRYLKWLDDTFSSKEVLYLDISIAEYIMNCKKILDIYTPEELTKVSKTLCEITKFYADESIDLSKTTCIFNQRIDNIITSNSDGAMKELSVGQVSFDTFSSVYDANNNGIVDNAEKVNGKTVELDVTNTPVDQDELDSLWNNS